MIMRDPLVEMVCEQEAQRRWAAGELPSFSSDLAEFLTCGYGHLNSYGEFEFPLYPAEDYLPNRK